MDQRYSCISHPERERGQSITEFALILVFLLVLLAGVFDLGRAFFAYIIVRDAAQEGAVYGSIAPKNDMAAFQTAVANRVEAAYLDPSNPSETPLDITFINIQVDLNGSACAAPGNTVSVTVEYSFPIVMPFLGSSFGKQDIELTARAEDSILAPICP
ncbi:MAG: pilus assembly protein [Anaerolineales bacterium]